MRSALPCARRSLRAFSLVEILVATALLTTLFIPVITLLQSGSSNLRHGAAATQALLHAQARLERQLVEPFDSLASIPEYLVPGTSFHLETTVRPFEGADDVKAVTVVVRWEAGTNRRRRSVTLRALRYRLAGS